MCFSREVHRGCQMALTGTAMPSYLLLRHGEYNIEHEPVRFFSREILSDE